MPGYYSYNPEPLEQMFVDVCAEYIKAKDPDLQNKVRIAKILVHVIRKHRLPPKMLYIDMGVTPCAVPDYDHPYQDFQQFLPQVAAGYGIAVDALLSALDEGRQIYDTNNVTEVRKKQYEEIQDRLYQTVLVVENYSTNRLAEDHVEFIGLLDTMARELPDDSQYHEFRRILQEYSILTIACLMYSTDKPAAALRVRQAFTVLNKYLCGLNTIFRKMPGYEPNFRRPLRMNDLPNMQQNAERSLQVLESFLEQTMTSEGIAVPASDDAAKVYSIFMKEME